MDIKFTEHNGRGRWSVTPGGADEEAEMTFSRNNDQLIMIDHTFVPESARGQGVGEALAERAVADAREKGWKIIPVCTFFKAQAEAHPDWDDVIKG
ncbi:GNAT family N-acetyltransferase [Sphingomicrobium flavum]|uniref:GNAT family N-acetyltransferase n=1 Tax=Sphingomicrobium flavum TaxID=1229164 RepID=UPI0021AD9DB1|nr:GNAT family N-acetyltransferase [Sphingomicrobium flavum]